MWIAPVAPHRWAMQQSAQPHAGKQGAQVLLRTPPVDSAQLVEVAVVSRGRGPRKTLVGPRNMNRMDQEVHPPVGNSRDVYRANAVLRWLLTLVN